ncbi:MAG: RsmE family RNA methyltransferase [Armatimonadota bacterium]|nr:RsmE family RNA methyltransferase [Armatimonadota bacterium]MDR7588385.1 RsmE family RNA methyltransferase [Armatimonadota bacterium]MDR7612538.1 RsmE family RNA methyltransferase [Armatimonadota bacterium]
MTERDAPARRFFVPADRVAGDRVNFAREQARHIATVLRLRPGDRVVAFDGSGVDRVVELLTVTPAQVTGRVVEVRTGRTPPLTVVLVQGVPRGAKMDAVVRAGTELGVAEFIPLLAARAVPRAEGRVDRWRRIAREAAQQCRRSDVPAVHPPMSLAPALARIASCDLRLVLWEGETRRTLADALRDASPRRVALVVGPEGGLTAAEVEEARAQGALTVTLGPLILRAETAGLAAVAMLLYELVLRRSAVPPGP